jgi:hypothetical protein
MTPPPPFYLEVFWGFFSLTGSWNRLTGVFFRVIMYFLLFFWVALQGVR